MTRSRETADYGHRTDFRNSLMNGNFNIWQRGTSFSSIANLDFCADRWRYFKNGSMVHDIERSIDVPNENSYRSLKIDCTTADATLGTSDYAFISYSIEGYDFLKYFNKYATLSFWVKSTKTGTMCIALRNGSNDASYIIEVPILAADTWEKKEFSILFDYLSGTWNYENGHGLKISFILGVGTNYHAPAAETWYGSNYLGTSNQTNFCDSDTNDIYFSQIQFELGQTASVFEDRHYQQELDLCQRYFISTSYTGATIMRRTSSANRFYAFVSFSPFMRTAPTITIDKNTIDTYQDPTDGTAATTDAANWTVQGSSISEHGMYLNGTRTSGDSGRSNVFLNLNWTADADL